MEPWIGTFIAAMLGHFVGDYLLQNEWMAINKSEKGLLGDWACTLHVIYYTLSIALFTNIWNPLFLVIVGGPHWLIDRVGLAWKILEWKNGHTREEVWDKDSVSFQDLEKNTWRISFYAPVYIMNDNTMHWVCLWMTCWFFKTYMGL